MFPGVVLAVVVGVVILSVLDPWAFGVGRAHFLGCPRYTAKCTVFVDWMVNMESSRSSGL